MEIIINKISDFPAIIQGAMGSALFWLILICGQSITRFFTDRYGSAKKIGTLFALIAHEDGNPKQQIGLLFCIYGSIHYALKAVIVLAFSFALSTGALEIFSIVGSCFGIYFLFRALFFVPHTSDLGTQDERKAKLDKIRNE